MWLTTNDGLVRFDGAQFKAFSKSNTPEITTNRLAGAFGDKSSRLGFSAQINTVGEFLMGWHFQSRKF